MYSDPQLTAAPARTPSREDLEDELKKVQSMVEELNELVEALTGIIAHKVDKERRFSEQIASAIDPLIAADTSDMDLADLVQTCIDFLLEEHARAEVMNFGIEDAPERPCAFLLINGDGRITGPIHSSLAKARAWAEARVEQRTDNVFTLVRRCATLESRVLLNWKEG